MAKENVKKFIEKIQDNQEEQKLMFNILIKQGTEEDMKTMLAHAEEAGVPFTEEEFLAETSIMNEVELDLVAGGTSAELEAMEKLLYDKGYIPKDNIWNFWNVFNSNPKNKFGGDCIPGGMATVMTALGIVKSNYFIGIFKSLEKPAQFLGKDGRKYTFKEVYEAVKQLPDWR